MILRSADIVPYRDMILDIRAKAPTLIDEGKSEQEALAAKLTLP